jgi:hypothetical protein
MKKIYTLLVTIMIMANVWAQSPQKFSYQAIIRNASNNLVVNHAIGIKTSILRGSASGTLVYTETKTPNTNTNGLLSIEIGGGTGFDTITWAIGPFFLKTETDPTGGTTYSITGTSQLLTVPYALYAANAGTIYEKNGKYGFGDTNPTAKFDFMGGNNWNLTSGEGDFRLGNGLYRLKMGVAIEGGGAGDAIIMQHGQDGGYNVLSLGAQGKKLLFLNGSNSNVGIGTDNPASTFTVGLNKFQVSGTEGNITFTDDLASINFPVTDATNSPMIYMFPSGTANGDRMVFAHSPTYSNWGLQYQDATDKFNFLAQGYNIMSIDLGAQKVSLGSASLSTSLEIQGNLKVVNGTQGTGKVLTSDANGLASWQNPSITTHAIGESYGGGIVFYVYDNGKHGLIAATADVSSSMRWYAGTLTNTLAKADGIGAGVKNTSIIIASQGYGDGATYSARLCNEYKVTVDGVTYGDWYLPSKHELNLLYLQKTVVGGFATTNTSYYTSSTEETSQYVWGQNFGTGVQTNYSKSYLDNIRPIRAF